MLEQMIFPEHITSNFIIRLAVAVFLGGVIGFERDIHGRAAGLRTNLLISLGAALFMLVSEYLAVSYANKMAGSVIRTDPARIAAQIVTGIGFLGAGAIIKYGFTIRGLTTAACIWLSASIGMSSGAGFFELAIAATVIGLFCLTVLNAVEKGYAKDSYRILEVETSNDIDLSVLIDIITGKEVKILYLDKRRDYDANRMFITFTIRLHNKGVTDKVSHVIVGALERSNIPIHKIHWTHQ